MPRSSTASASARRAPLPLSAQRHGRPASTSCNRPMPTARASSSCSPTACSRWTAPWRGSTKSVRSSDKYGALLMASTTRHATGFMGATGRGTARTARRHGPDGRLSPARSARRWAAPPAASPAGRQAKSSTLLRQRSRPYLFSNTVAAADRRRHRCRCWRSSRPAPTCATGSSAMRPRSSARGIDRAGLRHQAGPPSDRPDHALRCAKARAACRAAAGAGRLRGRLLLPRGAEGPGAYPHAAERGPHAEATLQRAMDAFAQAGRELGLIR